MKITHFLVLGSVVVGSLGACGKKSRTAPSSNNNGSAAAGGAGKTNSSVPLEVDFNTGSEVANKALDAVANSLQALQLPNEKINVVSKAGEEKAKAAIAAANLPADASQAKLFIVAAPALLQGALESFDEAGITKAADGAKMSEAYVAVLSAAIEKIGAPELNGANGLTAAEKKSLIETLVEKAILSMKEAGIAGSDVAAITSDIVKAAISKLDEAGVAKSDIAQYSESIVQVSAKALGNAWMSADAIPAAIAKIAQKAVEALAGHSFSTEDERLAAVAGISAAAVGVIDEAGVPAASYANASKEIVKSVVESIGNTGATKPDIKQWTQEIVTTSFDEVPKLAGISNDAQTSVKVVEAIATGAVAGLDGGVLDKAVVATASQNIATISASEVSSVVTRQAEAQNITWKLGSGICDAAPVDLSLFKLVDYADANGHLCKAPSNLYDCAALDAKVVGGRLQRFGDYCNFVPNLKGTWLALCRNDVDVGGYVITFQEKFVATSETAFERRVEYFANGSCTAGNLLTYELLTGSMVKGDVNAESGGARALTETVQSLTMTPVTSLILDDLNENFWFGYGTGQNPWTVGVAKDISGRLLNADTPPPMPAIGAEIGALYLMKLGKLYLSSNSELGYASSVDWSIPFEKVAD